jgi:hypothetical protein
VQLNCGYLLVVLHSEKLMKSEWIDIMKSTKRLKLSRWQTFAHFVIVVFISIIPSYTLFSLFEIYVTDAYDGVRTADELILITWLSVILAIAFYFIQKRQLRFREVKITYTYQEVQEAIERTAKENEWQIEINDKNILRAYRPWNWTFSSGEMITIILDKERLLLNSICDPSSRSSIASYGWNDRNIETFLKNLVEIKKDVSIQKKVEKPIEEWSLKKVLIRMFSYPFCLFLLGFGVDMMLNPVDWKSKGAGIGAIIISGIYLYSDLRVIIKNRNTKAQQSL